MATIQEIKKAIKNETPIQVCGMRGVPTCMDDNETGVYYKVRPVGQIHGYSACFRSYAPISFAKVERTK